MDPELAKIITEQARNDHYRAGIITLFGCVIAELADIIPKDRREHIVRSWRKLHLSKIDKDVAHIQGSIGVFNFIEESLFGTNDLDGESIRIIGRQMLDEMEPDVRVLLDLKEQP